MTTFDKNNQAQPSKNVINISDRLKRSKAAAQFEELQLNFDVDYKMPSYLTKPKKGTVSKSALIDAKEARNRALSELIEFVSQPENYFLFAQVLDGFTKKDRSVVGSNKINQVIDQIVALNDRGNGFGVLQEIDFPAFEVGISGGNYEIEHGPKGTILPELVSMAYIVSHKEAPQIILANGLGFRDMNLQARNAVFIAVSDYAKKIGVNIAPGPVFTRLHKVLDGDDFDTVDMARSSGWMPKKTIDVRVNHRIFSVPPTHYTIDNDLDKENKA
ncbi:hypothetical protein F9L33_09525 [Amylibacter sp. SFDW26]|uniref:hypothetical protein n=1 Tax=Amylibacter sp. SFDW26 TaxID=2652722 RepID=UPI001261F7A6|nr:hypothetical protein [Amylibacter sp. SFDW26]KAB7613610.1 hypothetical protein F9L33_09525 [Amylibacter sp. SFDW26]